MREDGQFGVVAGKIDIFVVFEMFQLFILFFSFVNFVACAAGGQGVAMLIERHPDANPN